MTYRSSIVILFLGWSSSQLAAQILCPGDSILDVDAMRMTESQLSAERINFCLDYYRNFPKFLRKIGTLQKLGGTASYYITFPNCLKEIQGFILKQDALLRKAQWTVTIADVGSGHLSQKDVDAAFDAYETARLKFCDYIKSSYLSD